jgi:transcriptional regulator with XRE-family HTH domain
MSQLVSVPSPSYAPRMAKRAAKRGDGPWGDAIQYWFKEKNLRQSHVVEGTGMSPNKASRAANGLDVRMETLRQFAEFFGVPLESVLVSPERRLSQAEEKRVIDKVQSELRRTMALNRPRPIQRSSDPWLLALARRLSKLPPKLQKSAIKVIADYEKIAKQQRHTKDGGSKPLASPIGR